MGSLASEVVQAACSPGDRGCESGAWMPLFRAAESSAARFVGLAVSTSLFSARAGEVLVMNSRMSLSLGNAFSRKPGSRARGGLKAGRPTDGRQAGRAQAFEPGCKASGAQQRRQLFAILRHAQTGLRATFSTLGLETAVAFYEVEHGSTLYVWVLSRCSRAFPATLEQAMNVS